jgi:hypothetical protein
MLKLSRFFRPLALVSLPVVALLFGGAQAKAQGYVVARPARVIVPFRPARVFVGPGPVIVRPARVIVPLRPATVVVRPYRPATVVVRPYRRVYLP